MCEVVLELVPYPHYISFGIPNPSITPKVIPSKSRCLVGVTTYVQLSVNPEFRQYRFEDKNHRKSKVKILVMMGVMGRGEFLPRQHWSRNILGFSLRIGQEFNKPSQKN